MTILYLSYLQLFNQVERREHRLEDLHHRLQVLGLEHREPLDQDLHHLEDLEQWPLLDQPLHNLKSHQ